MATIQLLRTTALSFPETTEAAHFEKISFKVKKKIFATFDERNNKACLKLSAINQDVFSAMDKANIYPVDNKWGKQGWTYIDLEQVNPDLFVDALTTAYNEVAPKKLEQKIKGIE